MLLGSGLLKLFRLVSTNVPLLPTQPTSSASLAVIWREICKFQFWIYALRRLRSSGSVTTLKIGFCGIELARNRILNRGDRVQTRYW